VSLADAINYVVALVQGAGVGAVFLAVLFMAFCVLIGYAKLRPSGPRTLTVRSLDEALGEPVTYLAADAPRGRINQLGGSGRSA
jgi:hypothetical protein